MKSPTEGRHSVWALFDAYDPQSDHLVGVYDSKAKAEAGAVDYEQHEVVGGQNGVSYMKIQEHVLNRQAT